MIKESELKTNRYNRPIQKSELGINRLYRPIQSEDRIGIGRSINRTFRPPLLSSELGGQTSAKPLSHGLLRVFIDWFMNNLQKLHIMGIAEAAVQLSSAFF
jgi:hypothetical protein